MVEIRKARLKDLDEIVELWKLFMEHQRAIGREFIEDRLQEFRKEAPEMVRAYFARSIRSRNGLVIVAVDDGRIRGYSLSRIEKNIPVFIHDRVGYLSDIYLDEGLRGRGIGTRMWESTLDWFKEKGIMEISIKLLFYNNRAHSAYLKWGFKDVLKEMRLDL